jgi:hypothetical protein
MRHILRAVGAALALAACGQSAPPAPTAPPAGPSAPFPNVRQTPFRAAAAMTGPDGASLAVVVLRDGARMRVEVPSPQGEVMRVTDADTGETLLWRRQLGRSVLLTPAAAPASQDPAPDYFFPDFWWDGDVAASMRRVGDCDHLGERGAEWARESEAGPQNVCITADGVVLWAANGGATVWRLTSLQRGPQDPSEFVLPAGVRPERAPEPVEEERDLNAAYVPAPQFSTRSDTPAPQNQ